MMKLCLILLLSILGLSFAHPGRQNYMRREMKGFNVTPRDEAQVRALAGIRNSGQNQNQQYFYQGGQIQAGRPLEILIPNHLESQFRQSVNAAGLRATVKYDRVKMNLYSNEMWMSQGENPFGRYGGPNQQPHRLGCTPAGEKCPDAGSDECCSKECNVDLVTGESVCNQPEN